MSEVTDNTPATWFWIVGGIAFAWNLMGIVSYLMQVMITEEALAALPEAERLLYESFPAWVTGLFAIAVFGGTIGCIGLLLKKKWAQPALVVSLICVLIQMAYYLFVMDPLAVYGTGAAVMPVLVIVIAIFLVWFAKMSTVKGWRPKAAGNESEQQNGRVLARRCFGLGPYYLVFSTRLIGDT